MKKNLILPVAGESSRYPNMRPKWMLTHPNGTFMLTEAIRGLTPSNFHNIVIIGLAKHEEQYKFKESLINEISHEYDVKLSRIIVVLLENPTSSAPETVYEGLLESKVEGGILIKDCDGYFKLDTKKSMDSNFVAVADLHKLGKLLVKNKSYVKLGNNNTISNIVEKKVISNLFCVGGYYFKDSKEFIDCYLQLVGKSGLYVSHIIYKMLLEKEIFFIKESNDYLDWGVLEDWLEYKSGFCTIFVDLDGLLVYSSAEHFEPKWGKTEQIKANVDIINKKYNSGKCYIIITTSRKGKYLEVTKKQLKKYNIKYHRIITDLPSAKRILINDYSDTNPYPSAIAINMTRDSDKLEEML